MLSYRHAYHAGNHADVLKHYLYSLVLDYYNHKEKPYCVIDTHAGAGMYQLANSHAQKNAEFIDGVQRLFAIKTLPSTITQYVKTIQSFNTSNHGATLSLYPGSPAIAKYYIRQQDQLRLFELHPTDYTHVSSLFSQSKQVKVQQEDGFKGLKGLLPPPSRRGVVLIDPPYEVKADYQLVTETIQDSLKRFATGCYLIWYPLLQRPEPMAMITALKQLKQDNWLDVTITVNKPNTTGFGMYGSGMFVINPPWQLPETLAENLPTLTQILAQDTSAGYTLNHTIL